MYHSYTAFFFPIAKPGTRFIALVDEQFTKSPHGNYWISNHYLLTRVTTYRPLSRSKIVLNWGFLHFDTDHAVNIKITKIAIIESSVGDSSLIMLEIQAACSNSKLAVLCKMKAPKAQSSGIFPTWLATPILVNQNSNQYDSTYCKHTAIHTQMRTSGPLEEHNLPSGKVRKVPFIIQRNSKTVMK